MNVDDEKIEGFDHPYEKAFFLQRWTFWWVLQLNERIRSGRGNKFHEKMKYYKGGFHRKSTTHFVKTNSLVQLINVIKTNVIAELSIPIYKVLQTQYCERIFVCVKN